MRKDRINTHYKHILGKCLSNNETVKGIFVVRREMLERQYVR